MLLTATHRAGQRWHRMVCPDACLSGLLQAQPHRDSSHASILSAGSPFLALIVHDNALTRQAAGAGRRGSAGRMYAARPGTGTGHVHVGSSRHVARVDDEVAQPASAGLHLLLQPHVRLQVRTQRLSQEAGAVKEAVLGRHKEFAWHL